MFFGGPGFLRNPRSERLLANLLKMVCLDWCPTFVFKFVTPATKKRVERTTVWILLGQSYFSGTRLLELLLVAKICDCDSVTNWIGMGFVPKTFSSQRLVFCFFLQINSPPWNSYPTILLRHRRNLWNLQRRDQSRILERWRGHFQSQKAGNYKHTKIVQYCFFLIWYDVLSDCW